MGLFGDADLVMTAGVPYTRTLQYAINNVNIDWTLYTLKSEVRDRDNNLLFTLTTYLVPLSTDHTSLVLTLTAAQVNLLPREAKWDLVATLISNPASVLRTPQPPGRVLVLPGVTSAP